MPDRPVLVVGATGATGRRLVARLLEQDRPIRALVRSPNAAAACLPPAVALVAGNVRDAAAVQRAMSGVGTVVSNLGSRRYYGPNGMEAVDYLGNARLARCAADEGVDHFVLMSAFGLDRKSPFLTAFSAVLNRYFHYKALAEASVRDSGVPFTFVRPLELRDRPAYGRVALNQDQPLGLLRTVSRDLVADALAACVDEPRTLGAVFEVFETDDAPPLPEQLDTLHQDGQLHLANPWTPLFPSGA